MAKELSFTMSKEIIEMATKPLRSRETSVLLLLHTLKMINASSYIKDVRNEKVIISINKMNRVFYVLNDKIFSMQFPFRIEFDEGEYIYRCSHANIDQFVVSFLIRCFNAMDTKETTSFDDVFDDFIVATGNGETISFNTAWNLIRYLLSYDLGYLRYDYDEEHVKEKSQDLHPLNHLDIFLDSGATFKIGLKNTLSYPEFHNILDTTTDCLYLQ